MTTTPTPAPNPIPPINTDEWAAYMINVLSTGGTVRDEDMAALVGVQTQQVRRVILALATSFNAESSGGGGVSQAYVDNGDSNTLASALAAVATVTAAYEAADDTVLTEAKAYTDTHSGTGGGVPQSYVDAQDQAVAQAAVVGWTNADQAVLSAAEAYTDQQVGGSGSVTQAYVDNGDANTLGAAATDATTKANAAVATANAYTDTSVANNAETLASLVDTKINANETGVTTPAIAAAQAAAIAAANAYTDSQSGGSGGGVSKTYVDTQDGSTLANAESYADTKDAANLTAAQNYAVSQAANAQTAAVATAASDATTKANNAQAAAIAAAATDATTKANNAQTAAVAAAEANAAATYQPAVSDTSWVSVAAPSGYASSMQYRKRGNRVTMRGALQINSGNITAVTNLFAFPAAARPPQLTHFIAMGVGAGVVNCTIDSSGNFTVVAAPTVAGNALWFDQVDYYTD